MIQIRSRNKGSLFVITMNKEIVGTIERNADGAFVVADKRNKENPPPFQRWDDAIAHFRSFKWRSLGHSSFVMPQSRSIHKITGRKARWSQS